MIYWDLVDSENIRLQMRFIAGYSYTHFGKLTRTVNKCHILLQDSEQVSYFTTYKFSDIKFVFKFLQLIHTAKMERICNGSEAQTY